MSEIILLIRLPIKRGEVEVSLHGFRELAADEILLEDVTGGVGAAIVVEDYPTAKRGPSVLVLQRDRDDNSLHVLWGVPKDRESPAVLITAYRPDPNRWSADFTRRTR